MDGNSIHNISMIIVFAPLVGAIIAGFFGKKLGPRMSHQVTIFLMTIAFVLAMYLAKLVFMDGQTYNGTIYTWGVSGSFQFNVGFLIDRLSTMMMLCVTFVSLAVHVYSIGYMHGDPGYQRFFAYISLFTFAMLMLVSANNFFQLFFGWEGVGLVSYLLIGFWFRRDNANFGSLKAFLVNRVGDFGFILGISAILNYFGSVDYQAVFDQVPQFAASNPTLSIIPGLHWSVITVICILLFIGAMGKSAQMPLHVWLPESMEGPTPISALIHAATMVTAGVFMVSRMSPLFELSQNALSLVLIIGSAGALFTGLIAIVQTDIKRVVAYSTLSQLGYMMAGLGASAFSAGLFHLFTHACFKALLFLGAGSVIIGMHHEQDMRKMGNLRKYMPITYVCFLIGALALSAIPPFAGYYSKDAIIEAVHASTIPGATIAYWCVLLGAFVTALYTFRAFFWTFHTQERMSDKVRAHLKESPWVVWAPLVALAIPSIFLGMILVGPMLYGKPPLLGDAIYVAPQYNVLAEMAKEYHGPWSMAFHSVMTLPFWLAVSGVFVAWLAYCGMPSLPEMFASRLRWAHATLTYKFGFDDFNQFFFVRGCRRIAGWCYRVGDQMIVDGFFVNGSGRVVQWVSRVSRHLQSGYLYHYAFAMILGLVVFLSWLVLG